MTRLGLVVVPVAAVLAGLLVDAVSAPAALVAGVVGVAGGTVLWELQRQHLGRLADEARRWLPEDRAPSPGRATGWRELTATVRLLGDHIAALETALAEQSRWRRHLVDALVVPSLLFSGDGRLVAANAAAREVLGVRVEDEPTILQAVGSAAAVDAAREVAETGESISVDVEVGDRELQVRCAPVADELLVLAVDRTRERRVRDLRRNFVVNASHELKTPATSIQALAEALDVAVGRDPERARQLVARLGEEAQRLTRVVHDLLDLRRLEDQAPAERVPVNLAAVVRNVVADLADAARARDVSVDVQAPGGAEVGAVPDDVRLIARNLIENAIAYNRPGGRVDVSLVPRNGNYELIVRDTGIGIPQQDLQRIFERFYRVDLGRGRASGGTGLGLSIVRHAVERHGGHIKVDSLLGEGSTFTVTFPVEPLERG